MRRTARLQLPAVGHDEPELLHGAPDEHHVQVGQRRQHTAQAIDRHHEGGEPGEGQPRGTAVQGRQPGQIQLRGQVRGEEPQRHPGAAGEQLDDLRVNAREQGRGQAGEHDGQQDGGRTDQAQQPALHEVKAVPPLARSRRQDCRPVIPPATKNSGMICRTHTTGSNQRWSPRVFSDVTVPSGCSTGLTIMLCPTTTKARQKNRARSITGSRSGAGGRPAGGPLLWNHGAP